MQSMPIVLEHAYKHGLSKRDIIHAWKNAYIERGRGGRYAFKRVLIGPDRAGRAVQLVEAWDERRNRFAILHAMHLTQSMRNELGLK